MKIPKRINDIIEELKDQYLEEDRCNRPWIIGFSGGERFNGSAHANLACIAAAKRSWVSLDAPGICCM